MNAASFLFLVYGEQHPIRTTIGDVVIVTLKGFPRLRLQLGGIWFAEVLQKRGFIVSITGDQDWLTTSDGIDDSPLAVGLAIQRAFDLRDRDSKKYDRRPSQVVFVAAGLSRQCLGPDALVVWHGNCYTVRTSATELPHVVHEASPE